MDLRKEQCLHHGKPAIRYTYHKQREYIVVSENGQFVVLLRLDDKWFILGEATSIKESEYLILTDIREDTYCKKRIYDIVHEAS